MEIKLTLRIDEALKAKAEDSAKTDRRSLNAQLCALIERGLADRAEKKPNPAVA